MGRALDEINDDVRSIIQPATTPIGTPVHQNDFAEVFENVADSIMRQDTIQIWGYTLDLDGYFDVSLRFF